MRISLSNLPKSIVKAYYDNPQHSAFIDEHHQYRYVIEFNFF